jgi:hypothetical protein
MGFRRGWRISFQLERPRRKSFIILPSIFFSLTNLTCHEQMMQQIHSDIVTEVPPQFSLLGSSDLTPVQGIVNFYPEDQDPPAFTHSEEDTLPKDPWRRVHIIAFQGKPFIDRMKVEKHVG